MDSITTMRIRPSPTPGRFQAKINGIDNKSYEYVEKFSRSGIKDESEDWTGQAEGNWMGQRLGVNWEYQKHNVKC